MRFSTTLNFPVRLLWLVSEQLGMFYLLHDTECAPRRKETSKTLLFLHSRFNKTNRRVHTQEMWVACADLSNTYSEKSLLISLSLMMRSAEKKKSIRTVRFCTGERSYSSEGDDSRSLLYLCSPSWGKNEKEWRARVLSGHAVRGKSARELLWMSLSVLGRSAAGDGIAGRISERRALEVTRNLWQMLWDNSSFKNNRRGSLMVPRNRIWAHNSLQQSALN